MRYPQLNELAVSRDMVEAFGGYNHNLRIGNGEFYDMKNLTSTHYPVLSPRANRGIYTYPESPQGMISKDTLCYVDGADFVIDGYHVPGFVLSEAEADCPKTLISMGAYVIIMPDRKWINTENLTDFGSIDAEFTSYGDTKFTLSRLDGSDYSAQYTQATEPTGDISNMALWLDTSSVPHTLKQYSASSRMWVNIATTYIRIESTGIGEKFSQYDGVTISGLKDTTLYNAETGSPIEGDTATQLSSIDGSMTIWERGNDYIVVVGMLATEQTISNSFTVSRKMPLMDFVVESGNRLWGCRYGTANNGEVVNEIYASKLGDFKNWNSFMGLSTDSYVVGVGSDGEFTGAITFLGHPTFFKENCMHKMYGEIPSNFGIQTTACRGVQKGSSKSLAIVNEVLYYKGRSAVCAYDGSLPAEISTALGEVVYEDAVAGVCGNKYYISMMDKEGLWHMFAYDTAKGMWHKEDNTHALSFCSSRGELYYIDAEDKAIRTVLGSGTAETNSIEWMAETGVMGTSMPDKKYISRILMRLYLDLGTTVSFYIQYDSIGDWEFISTVVGTTLRSFSIPIRPRRCDHFRLRIVGKGEAKIYSITKTIEQGSDL